MRDVEGTCNEFVGDFRNGYIGFGWDDFDEETKLSKRAIELNNSLAAMLGILGHGPERRSSASWSTRRSSPLAMTRTFPSSDTSPTLGHGLP